MNNFKRLSSWILMLTLVLCFTLAFASCGYVDEPADDTPSACSHADGNNDHKCDTCGEVLSQCSNNTQDHKCDLCGKVMGDCDDANSDHYCDVCNKKLTNCDTDVSPVDHKCDVCGKVMGECADILGNDHKCDSCQAILTQCADNDNNHKCDVCRATVSTCADGSDADHNCDQCGKSMCADGNNDGNCDQCGAPMCYDLNNDCVCDDCDKAMHDDSNGNHLCDKCNTKISECSDVDTDADHNCDVCQKNLCTDANNDYVCDGCGAKLARITAYIPSPMCSAKSGSDIKIVQVTEEGVSMDFTPVYHGGAYVIDFWAVYDSTGAVFAYVENGSKFKTTVEGVYTVLPVFIANNTTGVSDNDMTLDMSNGTNAAAPDDSCIDAAWADTALTNKLRVIDSTSDKKGYVLNDATDAQMYVTVDPTNAANTVLLWAVNSNTTGSMGNSLVTVAFDTASKGDKVVVSFDYQLEYLYSAAGIGTMVYLTDTDGNEFCISRILTATGTSKFSGTANTSTPVEGAVILKTLLNTSTTASSGHKHGSGTVNLYSDTWYTITLVLEGGVVSTYYSERGASTTTLLGEEELAANFDASKLASLTFAQGFYNNRQISLLDNIVAKRVHDCVDADSNHVCDTCSAKLCADGADADHNCDTCGDSMCFDGEIPDHKCEVCAAVSECLDAVQDHKCDICGTRKFGGDCADGADADHNCDYCGESMCADLTNDHKCDVCSAVLSECADGNNDHNCDICSKKISDCVDVDGDLDHKCDICKADGVTACKDGDDEGHRCDECNKTLCVDANNDGTCDGCGKHTCYDANNDGKCDGCKALTFSKDVTTGVSVYSFSTQSASDANRVTKHQTTITMGDPYDEEDENSAAAKLGVRLFRTADPDNASNTVLAYVCNNGNKAKTGNDGNVSTLVFDANTVVAGGKIHIIEFDFRADYFAKDTTGKDMFQILAIDGDGTRHQIDHSNGSYAANVSFESSATTPKKNAYTFGAPAQANEISSQINLDTHTWYRIRITFNQESGDIYYDVSFDNGYTWYLLQKDGKNFGTGLASKTIAQYGFQFNHYGLGGTFYFDDIVYTVTDTVPTRPATFGGDAVEHPAE